jgi:hypothetical protein
MVPRPDDRSGPRRRRRRRLLVALTILVVLYAGLGLLPIAIAALTIDDAAKAAADAAGQGESPGRAALGTMPGVPGMCGGLATETDGRDFHKGGTVTLSVTCTIDTPLFAWFGLPTVSVESTATSPVVVDSPYRFEG